MTGAELIAAERQRQMGQEGWTQHHDDSHLPGDLALAGIAYALQAIGANPSARKGWHPAPFWPWDHEWWKPKGTLRDLVRAGALIAAEIDRLQRLEDKTHN